MASLAHRAFCLVVGDLPLLLAVKRWEKVELHVVAFEGQHDRPAGEGTFEWGRDFSWLLLH